MYTVGQNMYLHELSSQHTVIVKGLTAHVYFFCNTHKLSDLPSVAVCGFVSYDSQNIGRLFS